MTLHRRRLFGLALAGFGTILPLVPSGPAEAQPVPYYPPIPPPRREGPRGRPPGPRMVWQPGHWRWDGRGYVWLPGRWVRARRGRWADGRWVRRRGEWVWVPGGWR